MEDDRDEAAVDGESLELALEAREERAGADRLGLSRDFLAGGLEVGQDAAGVDVAPAERQQRQPGVGARPGSGR